MARKPTAAVIAESESPGTSLREYPALPVPVADLATWEKVELFLPLGEHVVGATPTNTFCGGGTSEAAVVIRPEHQKILRIASGQSGDIHLQPGAF
jgi:hypothetical protein